MAQRLRELEARNDKNSKALETSMKLIHELHTNASASETINQREFDRIRDDLTEQALADAD